MAKDRCGAVVFQGEVRGMLHEAAEVEAAYGRDTMPRRFLGLNAAVCERYMHFIANRRSWRPLLEAAIGS
jgi:ribonucleotide reductase beta subunit family protein with ferritin-like domain